MPHRDSESLPFLHWTPAGRAIVFFLSATSIWCLLSEFYGLCSMRSFTFSILIPSTVLLIILAINDRLKGDGRLWRAVIIGVIGGFAAAVAYDMYRLPWVIGAIDKVGPTWLRLNLFKVFPQFGAMILGHPFTKTQTDSQFTLTAHVVGWIYHFSNGMTFGVMYMAIVGDATRRTWLWAVLFAVGLEIIMLLTPYASFFGIAVAGVFIFATLTAHVIFGIVLGLVARLMNRTWMLQPLAYSAA